MENNTSMIIEFEGVRAVISNPGLQGKIKKFIFKASNKTASGQVQTRKKHILWPEKEVKELKEFITNARAEGFSFAIIFKKLEALMPDRSSQSIRLKLWHEGIIKTTSISTLDREPSQFAGEPKQQVENIIL